MLTERVQAVLRQIDALTDEEKRSLVDSLKEQQKRDRQTMVSENGAAQARPDTQREREMQWIAEHSHEYAGQYVALDGERLIAHGTDGRAVLAAARQAGVKHPLISRIESLDEEAFWGGWL
jgi:hypothetical protein